MTINEIISSSLFKISPDPISIINTKGEILACNKVFLKEYCFLKGDITGRLVTEIISKKSQKLFKSKFEGLNNLVPQEGEVEVICGNGEVKIVWRKDVPLIENSEFSGAIVFDRDISDRIADDEKLKKQQDGLKLELSDSAFQLKSANKKLKNTLQLLTIEEEKNRNLIGAIPDYLFTLDEKGKIIDCYFPVNNPWNFEPNNFLNKSVFNLFPMPTAKLIFSNLNKSLKSRRLSIFYLTIEFEGVIRHQEVRMIAGEKVVLAIVRDITEKILADQALIDSEDKLRTIIQATNEGIIAIDEKGKVITFNRAAENIFQIRNKDFMGKFLDKK